jgi:hypothetical protein
MQAAEKLNGFILSNSVISVSTTRGSESNALGKKELPLDCILLENMYDPELETELNWHVDLLDEVLDECKKFGNIVDSCIPLTKKGEILIHFDAEGGAKMAQLNLDGRWFSEHKIVARQTDAETFRTVKSRNK